MFHFGVFIDHPQTCSGGCVATQLSARRAKTRESYKVLYKGMDIFFPKV